MSALSAPIRLSEHLYILYAEHPHVDSGNVFLVTGRHPTLIDCGSPRAVPRIVDNLAQLGIHVRDLAHVVATHGDFDHVQGYHGLHAICPKLRLRVHRSDLPVVLGGNPYQSGSYIYGQPYIPVSRERVFPFDDGAVIEAGDTELVVHHTPGHTDGSVCLRSEVDGQRLLFAGDAIGGSMRSLDGASLEVWVAAALTWRESLRRVSELDFDLVLTGHEPARSLPLRRDRIDLLVRSFGTMLNPWFLRGDEPLPQQTGSATP